MPGLLVTQPGLFTTVQDLGRPGHGASGVPPSGAADALSLLVGNRLLGNPDDAAALEITLMGPSVTLERDAWICLAGARCPSASVATARGEQHLPWCEPVRVRAGEPISLGSTGDGARSLLCVSGGLDVPRVLGSRSTLAGAAIGGLGGRPLRAGDLIPLREADPRPRAVPSGLHAWLTSQLTRRIIRVVPSLHAELFPPDASRTLCSAGFTVSEQSNRIGTRLRGPALPIPHDAGLLESEPTVTGGLQVSVDGQLIALGPDRPTTGGYPLIACVIEADLWAWAMLRPRERVHFELVEIDAARKIDREQREQREALLPEAEDAHAPGGQTP